MNNIEQMQIIQIKSQITNAIRININKLSLLLIITIIAILNSTTSLAADVLAQEYFITPKKKIETVIGAGELNRIYIDSAEITEVVGDENKYSIHWSSDHRNLFIFPKVEVGETIEISLIMSNGIAQDIRFTVGDCSARRIFIYDHHNRRLNNIKVVNTEIYPAILNFQLKHEIDAMMYSMLSLEKSKYFITDIKRNLFTSKELLIQQVKAYRYKNLSGAILLVKNKTNKTVILNEEIITNLFSNIVAINLQQTLLSPKNQTQILVITKEVNIDA